MILLASIWILLIQPNPGATKLEGALGKEFRADQVDFASQDDCETYAKKHLADLLTMKRRRGQTVSFPVDAVPTYTCVEQTR